MVFFSTVVGEMGEVGVVGLAGGADPLDGVRFFLLNTPIGLSGMRMMSLMKLLSSLIL